VKHGKVYASLEDGDDVLTVGLNRAVTLIAEKKANPKKGRRFGDDPGKLLGEHPDKGGPVVVKNGRYGPYVSNNGINATITGDKTPETITLTEAVVLLDARAEALGAQPRRAAGRKKAGEASEAPKGRKKKAAAAESGEASAAKPRKKAAKKKADKIDAAE
jgi:DNA topoisomerase-1